jgi:alpha-tubulin suppressor-like RCC1 family protein
MPDGKVFTLGDNMYGQLGAGVSGGVRGFPREVPSVRGSVAVAAGLHHSLALHADGTVRAWGDNLYGQLGEGTTTERNLPTLVAGLSNTVAVAGGRYHSLALRSDGTVWAWGSNWAGQLGNGTFNASLTPVQVAGLSSVVSVAAGADHSLALRSDGTVWAWGSNGWGQAGDATDGTEHLLPTQVAGLSHVVAIAAGAEHSLAVGADGTVWAWGANGWGQLGDGNPGAPRATPQPVAALSGVVSVAAGQRHSLALHSDGTVWAWGSNEWGQLGNGMPGDSAVPVQVPGLAGMVAVSAGLSHSQAVGAEASIWGWGANSYGQLGTERHSSAQYTPTRLLFPPKRLSIAAGREHSLQLWNEAEVWAWGANSYGQLGDGTTTNRSAPVKVPLTFVTNLAAGTHHSLARRSDGTLWAWGANWAGQLGDGTTTNRSLPVQVPGLSNVRMLVAGPNHSLAVRNDGTLWAWGSNGYHQLGVGGSTANRLTPVQVAGLSGVVGVATGTEHSLALRSDGTVWAWGSNWAGQLGTGTSSWSSVPTPVRVAGLTNVVHVVAGALHSLAVREDGTVWAWGANWNGQLGNGTFTNFSPLPMQVPGLSGVRDVAGGLYHSLAVLQDGTVWSWGSNQEGQLGNGTFTNSGHPAPVPGLSHVKFVAGSGRHALVSQHDGTLWAWGYNQWGQLGDGTTLTRNSPVRVLEP